MLWKIEIHPKGQDGERVRIGEEFELLTHRHNSANLITATSRGYLIEGELGRAALNGWQMNCSSIPWRRAARSAS